MLLLIFLLILLILFRTYAREECLTDDTLQQLPIKRTTSKILKALLSNAFKILLGLGLSAKRCKSLTVS